MRWLVEMGARPPVFLALIFLAAVGLLVPINLGQDMPWPHAIAAAMIVAVPGILFGLGAWRFSLRDHDSVDRMRLFLIHGLAAVTFAVGWTATIYLLSLPVHWEAAQAFLYNGAPWQTLAGMILYSAIAANAQWTRARERLNEQALVATRAQLQAARTQLDPHFLFNTLHTLTQLAREDSNATEAALERFGDLMRYALHTSRDDTAEVPFEDELAFTRNYLALEKLRLGDRLRVTENVDPESLELAVPPLLLQPLVENAVKHGIAPRREGGSLHIDAQVDNHSLVLRVADDGAGAEPDAWNNASGLGLSVVRRQLELRFPDTSEFEVTTAPGEGFSVRLVLPAHVPDGSVK